MEHEKMMRILYEVFDPSMPRLGPGDDRSTRRALEILYGEELEGVGSDFRVLDLGCGSGAQTFALVTELDCRVTAIDNHQPYLDELRRRAETRGLAGRIEIRCADLNGLDLAGETFDLIWAEGSIFVPGVGEALRAWRRFLKPGGAIGFTELVWFEDEVPQPCREFFAGIYPQMAGVEAHLATIRERGYDLVGRFRLPESSWWGPLYDPLSERVAAYRAPEGDEEAQAVLGIFRGEIENYRNYSRWFGYEFFLLRCGS